MKYTKFLVLVLAVVLASSGVYAFDGLPYRREVNISSTVGTTLTDFPAGFSMNTQSIINEGKMQGGCEDLVVSNGSAVIPFEVESGTCNTTATRVWVRIASFVPGVVTIEVAYGNASMASLANASGVWEDSYFGVYHGGDLLDSSKEGNNLSVSGTVTSNTTSCKYGYCFRFSGAGSFLSKSSASGLPSDNSPMTMSAWTRRDGVPDAYSSVAGMKDAGETSYVSMLHEINQVMELFNGAGTGALLPCNDASCGPNQNFRAMVYNGSAIGDEMTYLNDTVSGASTSGRSYTGFVNLLVGGGLAASGIADWGKTTVGYLDEIRFSRANRTSDWLNAEYGQTFSVGEENVTYSIGIREDADSNNGQNYMGNPGGSDVVESWQQFRSGTGSGTQIYGILYYVDQVAGADFNIDVLLTPNTTGDVPEFSTTLASATNVDVPHVAGQTAFINFTSPYVLQANTTYWIGIRPNSTPGSGDLKYSNNTGGTDYLDGFFYRKSFTNGGYNAAYTATDIRMRLMIEPAPMEFTLTLHLNSTNTSTLVDEFCVIGDGLVNGDPCTTNGSVIYTQVEDGGHTIYYNSTTMGDTDSLTITGADLEYTIQGVENFPARIYTLTVQMNSTNESQLVNSFCVSTDNGPFCTTNNTVYMTAQYNGTLNLSWTSSTHYNGSVDVVVAGDTSYTIQASILPTFHVWNVQVSNGSSSGPFWNGSTQTLNVSWESDAEIGTNTKVIAMSRLFYEDADEMVEDHSIPAGYVSSNDSLWNPGSTLQRCEAANPSAHSCIGTFGTGVVGDYGIILRSSLSVSKVTLNMTEIGYPLVLEYSGRYGEADKAVQFGLISDDNSSWAFGVGHLTSESFGNTLDVFGQFSSIAALSSTIDYTRQDWKITLVNSTYATIEADGVQEFAGTITEVPDQLLRVYGSTQGYGTNDAISVFDNIEVLAQKNVVNVTSLGSTDSALVSLNDLDAARNRFFVKLDGLPDGEGENYSAYFNVSKLTYAYDVLPSGDVFNTHMIVLNWSRASGAYRSVQWGYEPLRYTVIVNVNGTNQTVAKDTTETVFGVNLSATQNGKVYVHAMDTQQDLVSENVLAFSIENAIGAVTISNGSSNGPFWNKTMPSLQVSWTTPGTSYTYQVLSNGSVVATGLNDLSVNVSTNDLIVGSNNITVVLMDAYLGSVQNETSAGVSKLTQVTNVQPSNVTINVGTYNITWTPASGGAGVTEYLVLTNLEGTNSTLANKTTDSYAQLNDSTIETANGIAWVTVNDAYFTESPVRNDVDFQVVFLANLTGEVCQALTYPNADNAPYAARVPVNFTILSSAGFDGAEAVALNMSLGSTSSTTYSCAVTVVSPSQHDYRCNVSMQYYFVPGAYTLMINATAKTGKTASSVLSGDCEYGELVATSRDVDVITFPTAAPGVVNAPGNRPVGLRNTGNAVLNLSMTGYDLTGRTTPSQKLAASTFKAGLALGNATSLANATSIPLNIVLGRGSGAAVNVSLWVSMPALQMAQEYYASTPWLLEASS